MDDPRNTGRRTFPNVTEFAFRFFFLDNAWMETQAVNMHDETGELTKDLKLEAGNSSKRFATFDELFFFAFKVMTQRKLNGFDLTVIIICTPDMRKSSKALLENMALMNTGRQIRPADLFNPLLFFFKLIIN